MSSSSEVEQFSKERLPVEAPPPPLFLRLRTIALGCILFLSFLWIILVCIVMFAQWDLLDHIERSLLIIMLFIDTITVIMIPILLIQPFRAWLDAARVFFLILMHFGIALFFVIKTPSFECLSSDGDLSQEATCTTIIVFVNVFNWAVPLLAFVYGCGLALLVHRQSKAQTSPSSFQADVEKQTPKTSGPQNSLQSHYSLDSSREARMFAHAM
ncbi:hypothetical protein BDN70DRAFT_873305 [Pholiota conissans]|uniref:Uncharacterized protein n=1 Tax=Pholiota conissans TaxID=109636 RepID=A0A9P5ZBN2_9AGAR|nr:hypothetical protein BDN70DRAFT_873305 [Pholiota conissans]